MLPSHDRQGVGVVRFGRRQREEEGRAPIDLAFGPDAPSVFVNNPLNGRKADTRSLEIFLTMKPFKHAKQLVRILHIEPNPIVPYIEHSFAADRRLSDFYDCGVAGPGGVIAAAPSSLTT